jgi:copper(I)-binding protein
VKRFLLSALLALGAGAAAAQDIEVRDAQAFSANPSSGAVFMTIENRGHADRIVAAATPVAKRAELHTHVMENGIARMRPVAGGIELPEHGTVTLARGGLHVMLLGLPAPLAEGQRFPLTLTLDSGYDITVEVTVGALRAAPAHTTHGTHPAPATPAPSN